MRNLIFLIICILTVSCSTSKKNHIVAKPSKKESYYISKIDSLKNYYLIYAEKSDSIFKIVSKKNVRDKACNIVRVGSRYDLDLISYRKNALKINGMNTISYNVQEFGVDEETYIPLEGERGIYDIHFTSDIIGLCLDVK